jgi:acetyl-CoA acyltransferase
MHTRRTLVTVVIAGYARSPFHPARRGRLAGVRPDDLAGAVIAALVERTGVDPAALEDVVLGCAFPEAEQGMNLGRIAATIAGLPASVAGSTVNRLCGSSMQAVHTAAGAIGMGAGDAYVCAGVESMSRVPMSGWNPLLNPDLVERRPEVYVSMGETAENVAARFGVSRAEQEAFAVESQRKAAGAVSAGRLADEIVPVARVGEDGCPRPETTLAALAALEPAFVRDGTVTAGTSSPLTDGAAAVLVTSEAFARDHGLEPLARVRSVAVSGCDPEVMGIGPVQATRKAVERAGIGVDDLDVVELNEAFASQAVACLRELGIDPARVNIDGGAIALGHPLGATGARITGKAAQLLCREGGRFALATQCIGGGQGIATVLEAVV